jgi:VanZ family protein
MPPGSEGGDKIGHFAVYTVLGLLAVRAAMAHGGSWGRTVLLTLVAIAGFAALDEWHQGFIPGRFPDIADWVADVAGATVGVGSTALFTLRRSARS